MLAGSFVVALLTFSPACLAVSAVALPASLTAVVACASALPAAKTILDRHVEAIGGRKALAALQSIHTVGAMTIPANGMSGTIEVFAARPNKMLAKTTIAGIGEISEGFNGTHSWSISPMTGPMLATGEELAQKAFDADFDGSLNVADGTSR